MVDEKLRVLDSVPRRDCRVVNHIVDVAKSLQCKIRLIAGREVDYVGVEGFGLTLESTELLTG